MKITTYILVLLSLYIVSRFIYANEVPEDRTIYAFAPFYFDFGDQGEQVLSELIQEQHKYYYWDQLETTIPNPGFNPDKEGLKLKDTTVGNLAILSGVNNTDAITNVGVTIGSYVFRTARGPDMYAKIAINGVDFYQK